MGTAVLPRPRAVLPLIQEQYYRNHNSSQSKEAGKTEEASRKKEVIKGDVYVMIPPKPFQRGPPLNSTAFLRLKSTKKKRRKDVVFNSLRGAPNRLVSGDEMSGILKAHD